MRIRLIIPAFIVCLFCISCEEILLEEDISNFGLQLLAPSPNTIVSSSNVSFQWTDVNGATGYQIQVATPRFSNAEQIVINEEVEENSFSRQLPVGEYEWRVRAINSEFATSYSLSSFKVENNEAFSSSQVVLFSPQDDFITNVTNQNLEWQEVDGATSYRIQVLENDVVIDEETTLDSNVQINFPQGVLKWRVRAENDTQNTFYSGRNILVDTLEPNVPKLIKPEDEASLATASVTFDWDRDEITGSNETDSLYIYQKASLEELVEKDRVINSYNTILERGETYYWLMKAFDEAGNVSNSSSVFSFSIN